MCLRDGTNFAIDPTEERCGGHERVAGEKRETKATKAGTAGTSVVRVGLECTSGANMGKLIRFVSGFL